MASFQRDFFSNVEQLPADYVLGLSRECGLDTSPDKINMIIGAYRDNDGKPVVLDCVLEAEKWLLETCPGHEYLSQDGVPELCRGSKELLFGADSPLIAEGKIYTIQALSGTGGLRLVSEFIKTSLPAASHTIHYPSTTWANHPAIIKACGLQGKTYRYLDSTGCALDFDGMMEDIRAMEPGSTIMLHMCAHNPSGVDPTEEQWEIICQAVAERGLLTLFDNAYQGFVTGSPTVDAFPARLFARQPGINMLVCASFAKNFGLYGERTGAVHAVCSSAAATEAVASQLRSISRAMYSSCPAYGARIVGRILTDPTRRAQWEAECKVMADRLDSIRRQLYDALVRHRVRGTWEHVIKQRGMFSYTGISKEHAAELRTKHHIWFLGSGRISLAGLNTGNVDRFAAACADVLGTN